jgi:UDP-N-acetylmuramyl pentapeptide synthase
MKSLFRRIVVNILTAEAAYLLRRTKPFIITVTGSVGKTSTKDAIYTVLKEHCSVRKSEKSFNSEIGVPLTVLGLPNAWNNPLGWLRNIIDGALAAAFTRTYPEVLVLETGVDHPGDMARLTSWIVPDMVVLTSLPAVPVHVEFFASPVAVIAEKMQLVSALKPDGVLVYNADDQLIVDQLSTVLQRTVGYGRYRASTVTFNRDAIRYRDDVPVGTSCVVAVGADTAPLQVQGVLGLAPLYAAAAAIAVAYERGITLAAAATALETPDSAPNGRMRVLRGLKGSTIIDDTYNASPIAVSQALMTLKEVAYAKRRIAVLGDMLELGKFSATAHRRAGAEAAACVDQLWTVGVRAREMAQGALAHGLSDAQVRQYDDAARAGRELQAFLEPGDIVLVKGSQGMRMERIVEEVMAEPEQAEALLVRQDAAWRSR